MAESSVTVVLTSCRRFDLLERSLRSFFDVNDYPLARFILMEDSTDEAAREIAHAIDPGIEVHIAPQPRGQIATIDLAYGMVETEHVFHAEDDYRYYRKGFIDEGLKVLAADDRVSMVSGRRMIAHLKSLNMTPQDVGGVQVYLPPRNSHPSWHGYAFHTGTRRMREWRDFGPFAPYIREWNVSYWMKRAGFRMAYLAKPAYHDEDDGVSRGGGDPSRPRGIAARVYTVRKVALKSLFEIEKAMGRYDT